MVADEVAEHGTIVDDAAQVTRVHLEHGAARAWLPGDLMAVIGVVRAAAINAGAIRLSIKSLNISSGQPHQAAFGVVGAEGTVLDGGSAKLGHHYDHHVFPFGLRA